MTYIKNDVPKTIQTPKEIRLHPDKIFPIADEINGGVDNFRWNSAGSQKERRAYAKAKQSHKESIASLGLLLPFPIVRLPHDYTAQLDGMPHTYKKGDYVTIDFNGRLRSLKEMLDSKSYVLDTKDGKVLCADCTHMINFVVKDGKKIITDEVLQDMWDCVVALSTGYTKWDIFQFIYSGANVVTDKTQNRIFSYIRDKLLELTSKQKNDDNKLTANNVCHMTLGKIPTEKELRRKKLKFDLAFKRYATSLLDKMSDLRESMSATDLPAPFLDKLGAYLVKSAKDGYIIGKKWDLNPSTGDYELDDGSVEKYFESKHDLYTDEHFAEFEMVVDFWVASIEDNCPKAQKYTTGGWTAAAGQANREIHELAKTIWNNNKFQWSMQTGDSNE